MFTLFACSIVYYAINHHDSRVCEADCNSSTVGKVVEGGRNKGGLELIRTAAPQQAVFISSYPSADLLYGNRQQQQHQIKSPV